MGPPKTLDREDGSRLHGAVCDALGVDDISFQYSSSPGESTPGEPTRGVSRGFSINLERKQGRGTFKITIDNKSVDQPVRFLAQYTWPPSREHVFQDLDVAAEAIFETLGSDWERVLAETRIRGQLEAQGGSATKYMAENILKLSEGKLETLDGPISFASVGYETPAGDPALNDQLRAPKREISLEVLREDSRSLYMELMSQWPQLAQARKETIEIDAQRIRKFTEPPSQYLENSVDYIHEVALPLLAD